MRHDSHTMEAGEGSAGEVKSHAFHRERNDAMHDTMTEERLTDRTQWFRSRAGNRWRVWSSGLILTIFRHKTGDGYGWCVGDLSGPKFSRERFRTPRQAVEVLGRELNGYVANGDRE